MQPAALQGSRPCFLAIFHLKQTTLTTEQRLKNYIQAINEIAKSKIAHYKAESIMNEHPLFDHNKTKMEALEDFIKEAKLDNWAEGVCRLTDEV